MAVSPFSLRLDETGRERLAATASSRGETQSQLALRLIEEGLRMMEHPGIVFRDGPTGRRAALVSGPDIWEVVGGVRGVRDDGELSTVASDLGLTRPQLDAALRYYADFRLVASSAYPRDRANTDATIGRVVRALDALLTARPGPSDSLLVWLGDP